MTDTWYSPSSIRFTRDQMLWLISYLEMLKEGNWPPELGGGYVDVPLTKKSKPKKAYFETPCQFAAEMEERLKTTKEPGEALMDEINSGIIDYEGLSRPAKRALNYISGWRRRKLSYVDWARQNRFRGKQ